MPFIRERLQSTRRVAKAHISIGRVLLGGIGRALLFGFLATLAAWWLYGVSPANGFALGFALLFAIFFLAVAYKVIRARIQFALLRNEKRDLALARNSAGLDGGVIRRVPMTLWLTGPKDWSPLILAEFNEAHTRFAALLGEPIVVEHPLRILLFADHAWFLHYARRARLLLPSGLDGFYLPTNPGKIVAAMPNSLKRLAQPERFIRTLFGYYLLHGFKQFPIRPWLNIGVGGLVARESTTGEQARVHRKVLSAILQLRQPLNPCIFFRSNPKIAFRSRRGPHAEFADSVRAVFHAQSLLDYLAGPDAPPQRKEPFRAFLKNLQRRDNYDTVFRRHFGYGLDQLYNDWREWVKAKGIGEHEPPPANIRHALLDHVIPLVADQYAVPEDRIRAIRDMGQAGYTLGADTLIDLLRDRDREVRATAVWALEAISGTAGGENIAHWEAWWDALPRYVEPADVQDMSQADQRLFRKKL